MFQLKGTIDILTKEKKEEGVQTLKDLYNHYEEMLHHECRRLLKEWPETVKKYEQDFFVYPNNYNHFVNYYGSTFQHGGISLEEVLIPYISLKAK